MKAKWTINFQIIMPNQDQPFVVFHSFSSKKGHALFYERNFDVLYLIEKEKILKTLFETPNENKRSMIT